MLCRHTQIERNTVVRCICCGVLVIFPMLENIPCFQRKNAVHIIRRDVNGPLYSQKNIAKSLHIHEIIYTCCCDTNFIYLLCPKQFTGTCYSIELSVSASTKKMYTSNSFVFSSKYCQNTFSFKAKFVTSD